MGVSGRKTSEHTLAIVRLLREQGVRVSKISEYTGLDDSTIYKHTKGIKPIGKLDDVKGYNKDGHMCKTCKYRSGHPNYKCDYIGKTDHMRGCPAAECTKYEREGKKRKSKSIRVSKKNFKK